MGQVKQEARSDLHLQRRCGRFHGKVRVASCVSYLCWLNMLCRIMSTVCDISCRWNVLAIQGVFKRFLIIIIPVPLSSLVTPHQGKRTELSAMLQRTYDHGLALRLNMWLVRFFLNCRIESDGVLALLDAKLNRNLTRGLDCSVYIYKTNAHRQINRCFNFCSEHPLKHKHVAVKALLSKAALLTSNESSHKEAHSTTPQAQRLSRRISKFTITFYQCWETVRDPSFWYCRIIAD